MGDQVTIPRSFADNIGVKDTLPSIRRKYIPLPLVAPLNNTTTGIMWGADSNTTGIPMLSRNFTAERLFISTFQGTTLVSKSTIIHVQLFKNGVSTIFEMAIGNSTTQSERWHTNSTAPDIANLISTDKLSLRIPTRNEATKISVVLVGRERADS